MGSTLASSLKHGVVVDRDEVMCRMIRNYLKDFGVEEVDTFTASADVMDTLSQKTPDVAVVDYELKTTGKPIYSALREALGPDTPIVLTSGFFSRADIELRREDPNVRFVIKPFTEEILVETVRESYKNLTRIAKEPRESQYEAYPARSARRDDADRQVVTGEPGQDQHSYSHERFGRKAREDASNQNATGLAAYEPYPSAGRGRDSENASVERERGRDEGGASAEAASPRDWQEGPVDSNRSEPGREQGSRREAPLNQPNRSARQKVAAPSGASGHLGGTQAGDSWDGAGANRNVAWNTPPSGDHLDPEAEENRRLRQLYREVEEASQRLTYIPKADWWNEFHSGPAGASREGGAGDGTFSLAPYTALLAMGDPLLYERIVGCLEQRECVQCRDYFEESSSAESAPGDAPCLVVVDWEILCLSGVGLYSHLEASFDGPAVGALILSDTLHDVDIELVEAEVPTVLAHKDEGTAGLDEALGRLARKMEESRRLRRQVVETLEQTGDDDRQAVHWLVEMNRNVPSAWPLLLQVARYFFLKNRLPDAGRLLEAVASRGSLAALVEQAKLFWKLEHYDELQDVFKKVKEEFSLRVERITTLEQNDRDLFEVDEISELALLSFVEETKLDLEPRSFSSLRDYLSQDSPAQPPFCSRLASALNIFGVMLARHDQQQEAIRMYEVALRFVTGASKKAKVLRNLSLALDRIGEKKKAQDASRQAQALTPKGPMPSARPSRPNGGSNPR